MDGKKSARFWFSSIAVRRTRSVLGTAPRIEDPSARIREPSGRSIIGAALNDGAWKYRVSRCVNAANKL